MIPQERDDSTEPVGRSVNGSVSGSKQRRTVIGAITATLGSAMAGVGYLLPGQTTSPSSNNSNSNSSNDEIKIISEAESEAEIEWKLGDPIKSPHDIARAFDKVNDYRADSEWDLAYNTCEQIVQHLDENVIRPGSTKGIDTYRRARLAQWHITSDAHEAAEQASNPQEMKRWAEKGEAAGYRVTWGFS